MLEERWVDIQIDRYMKNDVPTRCYSDGSNCCGQLALGRRVHNDRGENSRRNTLLHRVGRLPCGGTLSLVFGNTANDRGERAQ
jgi:hypothetical protein